MRGVSKKFCLPPAGRTGVLGGVLHDPWYIAAYLGGCVVVMILARRKRHSALLFLGVSFFLTPLVGLLTVLLVSPRRWTDVKPPREPRNP